MPISIEFWNIIKICAFTTSVNHFKKIILRLCICFMVCYLHREMDRGAKEAGVKRIRIHDIRHSAVSLLIDMGFSATAIADRVGHESIDITYNYAHLFPSKQAEMAEKLNMERGN